MVAAGYYLTAYDQWRKCRALRLSLDASDIDPVIIDVIYHMDVTFEQERRKRRDRESKNLR